MSSTRQFIYWVTARTYSYYALRTIGTAPTTYKIKQLQSENYRFSTDFTVNRQSREINAMTITASRTPGHVVISAATVKLAVFEKPYVYLVA
jgi:hypothetical protein